MFWYNYIHKFLSSHSLISRINHFFNSKRKFLIKSIQQKQKLAYLGPESTYSYEAAKVLFGDTVIFDSQKDFDAIISAVVKNRADMGIVPFFNPHREHIRECQERLFESDLMATNVIKFDINLHLASNRLKLDEIKKVFSSKHVFKQCDIWLNKNLPETKKISTSSTAMAATKIKKITNSAAICSREAIAKNALDILTENIHNPKNFTLFFVIQKRALITEKGDYSFFCFKLNNSNEKMQILDILKSHQLRSTQKWDFPHLTKEYFLFFLEFFGTYSDLNVVAFKTEVEKKFPGCKWIGSFNKSITKIMEEI